MKINYIDLEKSYAVCESGYKEKEFDAFDSLQGILLDSVKDGLVEFSNLKELHFDGMTKRDQQLFDKEIEKHII